MHIVVLSDIFGHTDALSHLVEQLQNGLEAKQAVTSFAILTPYKDTAVEETPTFINEAEAYEYFVEHSSIDKYSQLLASYLDDFTQTAVVQEHTTICIIGFSVGASALWSYAGTFNNQDRSCLQSTKILGFGYYSSQIRKMTDLSPSFPLEFVFPKHEPHFCIKQVIESIKTNQNLTCRIVDAEHGFMNQYSNNFDDNLLEQECFLLIEKLSALKD